MTGTYSNGFTGAPVVSLEALAAAAREIDALPKVESDITVSPDIEERVRALVRASGPLSLRVWVDERLEPATWHAGKPLAERLRAAAAPFLFMRFSVREPG